jgi:hypothetical protein
MTVYTTTQQQADYNLTFRGDYREYPEHLWKIAQCLQTEWGFQLPDRPQKKRKGNEYGFFCMAMEDILSAASEFDATELLIKERKQFMEYIKKHQGIAPYTVAKPSALVNVVRSHAREARATTQAEQNAGNKYVGGQYSEFVEH